MSGIVTFNRPSTIWQGTNRQVRRQDELRTWPGGQTSSSDPDRTPVLRSSCAGRAILPARKDNHAVGPWHQVEERSNLSQKVSKGKIHQIRQPLSVYELEQSLPVIFSSFQRRVTVRGRDASSAGWLLASREPETMSQKGHSRKD